MSAGSIETARAIARELLAACSPGAEAAQAPVTAAFRCWTPLRDWEHGEAGIAALRRIVRAYCAAQPGTGKVRESAVISNGTEVVIEAAEAREGDQLPLSITLLLVLNGGLVNEVRCYVDPRAIGLRPAGMT